MAFAALGEGGKAASLFAMLNPINHARTRPAVHRYKVEPYVMAADIYAAPGHVGRGGWTWYTGSAAWMQRAGVESILGLRRKGAVLVIDPCIPNEWPGFRISVRHGSSRYEVIVENPDGVMCGVRSAEVDAAPVETRPLTIRLLDDAKPHTVRVVLGEVATPPKPAPSPRSNAAGRT
jgi:cyclic beta-1,2-glucan synthetase